MTDTYQPTPTQIENDLAKMGHTTINKRPDGSPDDPHNQPIPPDVVPPEPEPPDIPDPPVLSSLSPASCVSGDPDLTLSCIGSNFTDRTTIHFGDFDEPTTLVSPTEVTTIVKPSLFAPATVQVYLHSGGGLQQTQILDFTFNAPTP